MTKQILSIPTSRVNSFVRFVGESCRMVQFISKASVRVRDVLDYRINLLKVCETTDANISGGSR
ncbi:MAG: hypothetical protein M3405_13090 [Acidobacteriota bacterium]|nr:hypothetical protein [Acidobacteriota bacterium]